MSLNSLWATWLSAATQDNYICNFRAKTSSPDTVSFVTDRDLYVIFAFIAPV